MLQMFLILAWLVLLVLLCLVIGIISELWRIKARIYPGEDQSRVLTSDWFERVIDSRVKNILNNANKKPVGWFLLAGTHRRQVTRIVQESNTEYEVEYMAGTIHTMIGSSVELRKMWIAKKDLIRYMSYAEISDKILEMLKAKKTKK